MAKKKQNGDAMLTPFQPMLAAMPERALASGRGVAVEMARFYAHRLHAYGEYLDQLARCANVTDVTKLNVQFFDDARRDYTNEGAAIAAAVTLTDVPDFAKGARDAPA